MNILDKANTGSFLSRFNNFFDSVIQKVEVAYTNGQRDFSIWIDTQDLEGIAHDSWACVHLTVSGVEEFCYAEPARTTAQVISDGLHVCWFDDVIGIDFGEFIDSPKDLDELRSSKTYVVGKALGWSIGPSPLST